MSLPAIVFFLDETFSRVPTKPIGWASSSPMPHHYSVTTIGSISNPNLHTQLFFRTPLFTKPRQLGVANRITQICLARFPLQYQ